MTPAQKHTRIPCPSLNSRSLLKVTFIESVMPSHHLILYRPLLLLPSIFPSIRFFFNESIQSFSFSISPSIAYSGLISFRIDWFDLLAVQKTLKSLLQHHSLKASILWCSAFLMAQLTHLSIYDYWKNHSFAYTDLCLQNDVSAFNNLSRFVIAFLQRSKHLCHVTFIGWVSVFIFVSWTLPFFCLFISSLWCTSPQ